MSIIRKIRKRHIVSKESISSVVLSLRIPRSVVRKHLKAEIKAVIYQRQTQPFPKS